MLIQTAILALAAIATAANAQLINEDFKLTASDAEAGNEFGYTVDISGTTAIVGATLDNDGGTFSGSAFLYDTTSGQQLYKLTALDPATGDLFGYAVGISGTTAIAGVRFDDDAGEASGSAYLFDTTTGQQLFKLTASDAAAFDFFGASVAISGTTAIIGAYADDDGGTNSGSAYLFDTTTGQQLFKLTASDAAAEDQFGIAVAISGTTAIVGAYRDDNGEVDTGSAYVFDTTTGQQLFKLIASDAAAGDFFGVSVAISGTTTIVGAHRDDGDTGSAYLFDTTTGQQLFKLTASDAAEFDYFGISVAISGTTAIIGAYSDDDGGTNSGSAYLFDTTTGTQLSKLAASDAAEEDWFGYAVAISGTTAIAGALKDDDAGNNSGSAYVFNTATPCPADLNGDDVLDFFDVSAFLTAFVNLDPLADFTGDGVFDFFDVSAFLLAFGEGCP